MYLNKSNIIILSTLFILIVLGLYYTHLANSLSDDILESAALSKEIDHISQENARLRAEIAEQSSYRLIVSKAVEFGFQKATEYIEIGR